MFGSESAPYARVRASRGAEVEVGMRKARAARRAATASMEGVGECGARARGVFYNRRRAAVTW